MTIEQLLLQLGVNISSATIYDIVKYYLLNNKRATTEGLQTELSSRLNITDARINALSIIEFLARNGDITIQGSHIYASRSITMASSKGTQFEFGNNSYSRTNKSAIKAGEGAQIIGRGGAKIEQDEDGNIKFFV